MAQYTVKAGDTLGKISAVTLGDASRYMEIAELNNMSNPNAISVGQVLQIPVDVQPDAPEPAPAPDPVSTPAPTSSGGDDVISEQQLAAIMPNASDENIARYTPALNNEMTRFSINTPMRIAQFIAQIAHESGCFRYSVENLNYSAKALRAVFGKYFPDDATAEAHAREPEKIANRVYANRMGNGDEASGDGWKFRGRGLIQLTGKDNYTKCGRVLGKDLIADPDQLADDANASVAAAGWFWNMRSLNGYADADDIKSITKRINGGYNGLEDREKYLAKAKEVLGVA